jgi:YcxB-like protein
LVFLYPIREKNQYIKHYKGFILENYKEFLDVKQTLSINSEHLFSKSNAIESKIDAKEIPEIVELPKIILLRLGKSQSIILPKNQITDLVDIPAQSGPLIPGESRPVIPG